MQENLPLWIAALETGFYPLSAFVQWADHQIMRLDNPPLWFIDLSLASSVEQATSLMWQTWMSSEFMSHRLTADERGRAQCWHGFLYLRYERGELGLAELLKWSGQESDNGSDCGVDCETFYLLLNEIDGGGPTVPSDRPLVERVTELYGPFVVQAREAATRLPPIPA